MTPATALRFTLSSAPVTGPERETLDEDVARHGLDAAYFRTMNGLLAVTSRSDTPLVLRAMQGDTLRGLAYVTEVRRTTRCLFRGLAGRLLDTAPLPTFYWQRAEAAVDHVGCPGLVAPGEDPGRFGVEALAFLTRRYPFGSVLDLAETEASGPCHELPFVDSGRYDVEPGGVDRLVAAHRHLRRKESKYRGKGGRIEVRPAPLDTATRDAMLRCLAGSSAVGLLRTPFQENYANLVRWTTACDEREVVHVLARLGDDLVGYHSFLRTGVRLQCLSGGFDRTRHSNYHAYENVLLAAMRHAEAEGLRHVAFGPVSNPSKASVMPGFARTVLRFHARSGVTRGVLGAMLARSAMRPSETARYANLQPVRDEA